MTTLSLLEVAALVAEYDNTRSKRLKLNNDADKLEQREKAILDALTKAGVESGTYGPFSIEVGTKKVPRVTDWPGFHQYILSSGNIDMLTKHLTPTAIMARLDDGEYVPGVVTDEKTTYKFGAA